MSEFTLVELVHVVHWYHKTLWLVVVAEQGQPHPGFSQVQLFTPEFEWQILMNLCKQECFGIHTTLDWHLLDKLFNNPSSQAVVQPSLPFPSDHCLLSLQIAKVEKLKPLEVELRRLEDLSESIVNDFAYMKKREEEMRDTNGNTTQHIHSYSVALSLNSVQFYLYSGKLQLSPQGVYLS